MQKDNGYIKLGVDNNEYNVHRYVYDLQLVKTPSIIEYDKSSCIMSMEKVDNMCISDFYGDSADKVPDYIFDKIRKIIKVLYDNGIEYPDITGYNFIEYEDDIWIIDYGHASFIKNNVVKDDFVIDFMNGLNSWNPNYR
jgi:tRNA A-37 threonylcarbamoyl transferase component Bud32